jgi:hypothetical protein
MATANIGTIRAGIIIAGQGDGSFSNARHRPSSHPLPQGQRANAI